MSAWPTTTTARPPQARASASLLTISPNAVPAWLALADALTELEDGGRAPVCRTDPDRWHSKRAAERAEAAEACGWCPVRRLCLRFAEVNDERFGVWGGRLFGHGATVAQPTTEREQVPA